MTDIRERINNEGQKEFPVNEQLSWLVQDLKKKCNGNAMGKLLDLFPSLERQHEVENAGEDDRAKYVAELLGISTAWFDATFFLGMYRPHDGGTAAGELGLSRDEGYKLLPKTNQVADITNKYIDDFVDRKLGGDITVVAKKLKTVGQMFGFVSMVLRRSTNQGISTDVHYKINFNGDAEQDRELDEFMYLDQKPRNYPILSCSFDPETNTLQIQLPAELN